MSYINWKEAREKLNEAWNLSAIPSFKKLEIGTIIDEDKSVKWNREEVERINKDYDEEVTRLRNQKQSAINEVEKQIYEFIAECTGLPVEKAPKVWSMVYADHHSGGLYEIFGALEEMCDFLYELLN